MFPPLPPQAEQASNRLVQLLKVWLDPFVPLILLYGLIELKEGGLLYMLLGHSSVLQ